MHVDEQLEANKHNIEGILIYSINFTKLNELPLSNSNQLVHLIIQP